MRKSYLLVFNIVSGTILEHYFNVLSMSTNNLFLVMRRSMNMLRICDLGKAWEYESKKKKDVNSQLITKYNLIKNIPLKNQEDIPCQFYPEISFEGLEKEPSQRKDLEKQYT